MSGAGNSNVCPAGSVRIETESECRTAAAAAGKPFGSGGVFTAADYPRGCFHWGDWIGDQNGAFFNPHAVGAGRLQFQPLCAVATTGVPPHADACACDGTSLENRWVPVIV